MELGWLPIQSSSPTVVRSGINAWKTCALRMGQGEKTNRKRADGKQTARVLHVGAWTASHSRMRPL